MASFFGLRPGEVPVTADDSDLHGSLSFLADLEPYTSAKMTQVTFRRWSGYIAPSPRSQLQLKWRVPGHLVGVHGWSSNLYRSRGVKARVFLVRQDPDDGNSAVTWGREYPDVVFADVLRNDAGRVFEVRVAEKRDGQWERFIAFKDVAARPHGYIPPRSGDCRTCHSAAGRSEYAGAAIPGADSVISEAIEPLEAGRTVQGGFGTDL